MKARTALLRLLNLFNPVNMARRIDRALDAMLDGLFGPFHVGSLTEASKRLPGATGGEWKPSGPHPRGAAS